MTAVVIGSIASVVDCTCTAVVVDSTVVVTGSIVVVVSVAVVIIGSTLVVGTYSTVIMCKDKYCVAL